ncbi:MAG: GNAT family N-acetyltransferase [Clostridiales bacterium]|nr:GNAT family N-acetyltransferase [Clostridiales bacterium]
MKSKITIAKKEDAKAIRHLWDACFQEDSIQWRDWYFKYIFKPNNTLLLKPNNTIASMIHINPYTMNLNNKSIQSAALSGVATYENQRKKGYAGLLIQEGLKQIHKKGIAFSFLYPFNYDFYKKFGYDICYSTSTYICNSNDKTSYTLEPLNNISEAVAVYDKFCKDLNGYIERNTEYMKIKLEEHYADDNKAYIMLDQDKVIGYCLLKINSRKVEAEELISLRPHEAAKAISYQFQKSIEYESPIPDVSLNSTTKPHCMGRIINVVEVFQGVASKKNYMIVRVIDNIISENNKTYLFDGTSGRLEICMTEKKPEYSIDIKALSKIAVGYKQGLSGDALQIYNQLFDEKIPWIKEIC